MVSSFSEHDFIKKISNLSHVEGIGDDCCVEEINKSLYRVTSTDLLVEGIHFIYKEIGPYQLAKKAMSVNISDIVAMGAIPKGVYLSVAFPRDFSNDESAQFLKGLNESLKFYEVKLKGGDTCLSSDKMIINIFVEGHVEKEKVKRRSGAQVGDLICLARQVGNSDLGLRVLMGELKTEFAQDLIDHHHNPIAEVTKGSFFSEREEVTSMIDVSDGIYSEVSHLCEQAGVSALIESDKIPLTPEAEYCLEQNLIHEFSFSEEYCLLLTVTQEYFDSLSNDFQTEFNQKLTAIGTIVEQNDQTIEVKGQKFKLLSGFYHGMDSTDHAL